MLRQPNSSVISPVAICMQSKANAIGDAQQRHGMPLLPLLHYKGREEDSAADAAEELQEGGVRDAPPLKVCSALDS